MEGTDSKRVLIVEDHAAFREALARVLEWHTEFDDLPQAGSLDEARARVRAIDGDLDVAVVDLFLPDGHGAELVEEISKVDPEVPVLVLTVSQDPGHHARALEAGAERVLTKDAPIEDILDEIQRFGAA